VRTSRAAASPATAAPVKIQISEPKTVTTATLNGELRKMSSRSASETRLIRASP
jgi:hypothetical protein